ncbi:electron transport complex subunit RsxG [Klebsiella sp. BIGb0407]|uniref:electron transport complex subunit RsxG n=1 Tax=Klebsiella sp. BIGb0407 TaxID=2940603 RepID=UPI00216963B4|nr:electron transport complex subunit RsxG [Klebsiella sp. BIGb0407]MCS3429655.1 electron transport complex protein RnfG [Klebsiella sp. BIGb0407]
MLKTMQKHGVTLAVFAALLTGVTALVNELTKPTIDKQAAQQQQLLFDQVISHDLYDNDIQSSCFVVKDTPLGKGERRIYIARKGETPVGVVMEATAPDGYSGAIHLLVGADFNGTILGTRVTEHHETPGLGDKIELRLGDWITHFAQKHIEGSQDPRWAVQKDGGEFTQFTGATITPRAVVNAVKRAGLFAETLPPELNKLSACGEQQ